ncbi:hypothetical protein GMD4S_00600 [Streptococcus sp. GMD4S]|uniref:restriction endonuclease subunit S n=1 Tax=unclassified Streptococcus TaxID=2608887 RepID=UPI000280D547|nr:MULTISPECIES: restriction endonuclease subunit S [unclassified Streptococcus]EKA07423.1 hypothetical protein GMD6S_00025 [Streptococcus sp. GMD6S]EKA12063.1 hypothetical protein GMD4S_00600 [Streptococcus sp. GMD4S]EKA16146.1 hypothetical protein GMD2S_04753 [Streptococcus sp. GMD2S]EKA18502.1 hypothetical protein GMD1S_00982 [Streptococcus sp. GMD1S]
MTEERKAPAIRFKEFSGQNAEAWEQRKLEECSEISAGGDIDKSKLLNNGKYPVVANALTNDGIIGYYNDSFRIEAPAVTVTGRGNVGVAKARNENFTPVVRLLSLKSDYDVVFLENAINTQNIVIESTGVPQLTVPQLGNYKIFFPSPPEQRAIGSLFQDLDKLITLQQRKLEVLKEQKKTYLKLLSPAKGQKKPVLRFAGFEDEWKEVKVSDIFRVTRGQVLATTEISEEKTDTHKYPVYSSQTKNEGLLGYYDKYLFETAVTWTTDGANAGTVNYREGKFYSTNVNGVLLSDEGFANKVIAEILNNEAWKYVSKVGNPKLMNNVMSEISLVIPNDFREISILSSLFQDLDKFIALQQRRLDKLQNMKKALLEQMMM